MNAILPNGEPKQPFSLHKGPQVTHYQKLTRTDHVFRGSTMRELRKSTLAKEGNTDQNTLELTSRF